jgi:hypothetical protein
MKVNVQVTGKINSSRTFSPKEIADLLKNFLGKTLTLDVSDSITVDAFANQVAAQINYTIGGVFIDQAILLNKVALPKNETLKKAGVKDNTNVVFQIIGKLT